MTVRPFLMFQGGVGRQAVELYQRVLGAQIVEDARWPDGTIMKAKLAVRGQEIFVSDSPVQHAFGFTPAVSLFVDCSSPEEIDSLAAALGEGGEALMPLGDYGFSRRFAWLSDRFGVSWQLNLP